MTKILRLILIVFIALLPLSALAQSGSVEYSSEYFPTSGRKVAISCKDKDVLNSLTLLLAGNGAIVKKSNLSTLFSPKITVTLHKEIKGYKTAYSIDVKYSKVKIKYTSEEMLELAISDLRKLFDSQGDKDFIRGCKLFFYNLESRNKNAIARNDKGILDGVSTRKPTDRLCAAVAQVATSGNRQAVVALANQHTIRVDFKCLEGINPSEVSMASVHSYSLSDIEALRRAASNKHGEFVPAINLLSDNNYFEQYTGHAMTSVEGMRFVRAMIEECATLWGVKTLCIGTIEDRELAPQHYLDFLDRVSELTNIKLLVL